MFTKAPSLWICWSTLRDSPPGAQPQELVEDRERIWVEGHSTVTCRSILENDKGICCFLVESFVKDTQEPKGLRNESGRQVCIF